MDRRMNDDLLNDVNGGRVYQKGYDYLRDWINKSKSVGRSKEKVIEMFTEAWNNDSYFKSKLTDGKVSDFNDAIAYINQLWD